MITHPLLDVCGVVHGFGTKSDREPPGVVRPRQVHGVAVMRAHRDGGVGREDADAVVSDVPGLVVAVVTADCVPLLVSVSDGSRVAAIHAGWRGLVAGVVRSGLGALFEDGVCASELRVVIGPHIGPCCYEVDAPVLDAVAARFGREAEPAWRASRAGHAQLDLGLLARLECLRAGLETGAIGAIDGSCTRCDAERFHSYRRDGPRAGRLVHHVAARVPTA